MVKLVCFSYKLNIYFLIIPFFFHLESHNTHLTFVTQLLARFFIAGAFGIIRLYGIEMFPTTIRARCLGICAICGKIGTILALALNVI
jgi:hypothetical protein